MDYYIKEITASKGWGDKRCHLCGKHIKNGDKIGLIIPEHSAKLMYKRLALNVVVHIDEFENIRNTHTDKGVIDYLGNHSTPRADKMTEHQLFKIEMFIEASKKFGFNEITRTTNGVKCKFPRSSETVEYNAWTDKMSHRSRSRSSLFENIFKHEVLRKLENVFLVLCGEEPKEEISAVGIINTAIDKVNTIIN